jgi:glutathione synthase/RimK-type ligase-like ATP-grasp enzyme
MPRIALVTAIAARALDDDMQPLLDALHTAGINADVRAWDDPSVAWSRYDIALLRSTWDYTMRLDAFLAWCEETSKKTRLLNPLDVVRWNTDKRYLAQLESIGIPIVPTEFFVPGDDAVALIAETLAQHPTTADFVIKPTVGAGSRGARRHPRAATDAMRDHARQLFDSGKSVLMQPYLPSVDAEGESALLYFDGLYSHALRKGALLKSAAESVRALFASEHIQARTPGADERALADRVMSALPQLVDSDYPLAYARVDLVRAPDGSPCVLELELAEPSLFLAADAGAGARFAAVLRARLAD